MSAWRAGHPPERHALQRETVLGLLAACVVLLSGIGLRMLWPPTPFHPIAEVSNVPGAPGDVRPFFADGVRGWLVRRPDGRLDAFWARSTHRGCFVDAVGPAWPRTRQFREAFAEEPGGRGFVDVCFDWRWALDGTVRFGGPPRGLDRFTVTEQRGHAEIDLTRITLGACAPGVPPWWHGCSRDGDRRTAAGPARTGLRAISVPNGLR